MCNTNKEKVAIVNSVYEFGSTGALTKQLYEHGEANGYETFVFYGRGKRQANDHLIRIDSVIEFYLHKILTLLTGYQGSFSNLATSRMIKKMKKENIKKVILLNLHGYYLNENRLLEFLKARRVETAYVTPDEYAGLGKCCYNNDCERFKTECVACPLKKEYPTSLFFDRANTIFNRKKKNYLGFDTMTLVGPETNLAKFRESALLKDKPMKRVSWGVDLDVYRYKIDDSLHEKYDIPTDKVIILTVANYSNPRKGVREYFFEIAKRLQDSEYHFINVGYDGDLKQQEIPTNMTTIGYLDNQEELASLYAMADLYVLASTSDTMPISCLISFACETPVCCFYTSGLKYLAPRNHPAIKFCDEINLESLEAVIKTSPKKDDYTRMMCRNLARDEYSIEAFNEKVYEVIGL